MKKLFKILKIALYGSLTGCGSVIFMTGITERHFGYAMGGIALVFTFLYCTSKAFNKIQK